MVDGYEKSRAFLAIQAERRRQIDVEGWTAEHDDTHSNEELAQAAVCYAMGDVEIVARDDKGRRLGAATVWPWHRDWWKPTDRRRNLVKAGALIVAEIERLDRATARNGGSK